MTPVSAASTELPLIYPHRQESKDRLRAENDYRVNLKAELEIRQLHSKVDMLLTHQWQRLLEIQQIQTDGCEATRASSMALTTRSLNTCRVFVVAALVQNDHSPCENSLSE
jgi:uncharacterized membrane protein